GKITVTAIGGKGTYTYKINSTATSITLTDNIFSGVPSGTYIVTVTDDEGCTATAPITLEAATPADFDLTPTAVTCFEGTDGTITVSLEDDQDNPVYTYQIIAGPETRPAQNSNVFTGLAKGTYTVQVNSGRGCDGTDTVEVVEADLI